MVTSEKSRQNTFKAFAKFGAIWGQKWLKPLEDDILREATLIEWDKIFSKLEDEQIKKAIQRCKLKYDFPPSIAEFVKSALEIPHYTEIHSRGFRDSQFVMMYHAYARGTRRDWTEKECEDYHKQMYYRLVDEFLDDFMNKKEDQDGTEMREVWEGRASDRFK